MIRELFSDDAGHLSIMRVISFILVIAGIGYMFLTKDWKGATTLIGFAVGGKSIQRFGEKK